MGLLGLCAFSRSLIFFHVFPRFPGFFLVFPGFANQGKQREIREIKRKYGSEKERKPPGWSENPGKKQEWENPDPPFRAAVCVLFDLPGPSRPLLAGLRGRRAGEVCVVSGKLGRVL